MDEKQAQEMLEKIRALETKCDTLSFVVDCIQAQVDAVNTNTSQETSEDNSSDTEDGVFSSNVIARPVIDNQEYQYHIGDFMWEDEKPYIFLPNGFIKKEGCSITFSDFNPDGTGWISLDSFLGNTDTKVYVTLSKDENNYYKPTLKQIADIDTDDEDVILLCNLAETPDGFLAPEVYINSTIFLANAKQTRFFDYDSDTQTIGYGIVYVGNKGVYVSPLSNVSTDDYRVKVTINGFGATASHTAVIEAGSYTETPSDDNVVYIGLYTVTDDGITNDYRCEPYIIQAWS